MADYIPLPVIENMLSRLPVKSLLRFRCVSKQWCSLIDNPNFIRFHLNYSQQTTTSHTLVLRDCYLYTIDFPALDRAVEIDRPLKTPQIGTDLVGCCNGLICLTNGEEENEGTILYNPATKKHRRLPFALIDAPEHFACCERTVYGFGYDRVTDDYKVVRIVQFYPETDYYSNSDVRVYSLKGNSWRRIEGFPYFLSYKRCHGIHVNGCLHWLVQCDSDFDDERKFILSFDLRTEKFMIMPQPSYPDPNFHMNVDVLNGCLCVLSNYYMTKVDVWIMKEYGDAQSWTKLLSISKLNVGRSFEYFKPIAYSQNGYEVLVEQDLKYLFWYDLRHERARMATIQDLPTSFEAYILVESLVPLDGLKKKKKKKKKPKKTRNDQKAESSVPVAALPLNLVSNILSWLPTKSLFRFKCVCKTWNTLIGDPNFVQKHLEVHRECSDRSTLVLREEKIYSVDFNHLDVAVEINHPLSCCGGWTDILGSCNGLLCLYNEDKDFTLRNPSTGRYFRLPITKNLPRRDPNLFRNFIHGFGYDSSSNDYEIVWVLQLYDNHGGGFVCSDLQLYSLKANCWKTIQDFPYILCYPCPGVFSNGALYWVARQSRGGQQLYS